VYQAMAADGVFFPRLARLHPVHRTPAGAIVLQAAWASALALSGSFSQLVDYVAFADWVFFGLTVAGLFVYRARDRSAGKPACPGAFRVPGYPWTPAVFVAAAVFVVASSVLAAPRNALIGTGLLVLGVPVFWYWSREGRKAVAR
jgi:APA family basic amino acid/polyamine antiporter